MNGLNCGYKQKFRDELFRNCLPFWLENGKDGENGGIYTCLDRSGKIYSTDKSVWMQGRCGWIFSFLCNTYGYRKIWAETAKSCIDFIDRYCIDEKDGRMYFTVTGDGKPIRKRRYFFSETFAIMAHAEYSAAANDKSALEWARRYYGFVLGIYNGETEDPYRITPKVIPETRSCRSLAEPMILLNVTKVMRRCDTENTATYDKVTRDLVGDILKYHYREKEKLLLETVGKNGEFLDYCSTGRLLNPGHDIEASWFLLEASDVLNDKKLAATAEDIFNLAYERGHDKEYGGLIYYTDAYGFPPEPYEHDMKLWWVHNETIIASLMLYLRTGNDRYKKIFEEITDYAFSVFSDPGYGEWFGYLRRDGKPTEPPCKGSTYKGPFHLPRMCIICDSLL